MSTPFARIKITVAVLGVALTTTALHLRHTYRRVVNDSFVAGEYFEYRVHYGLLSAAEAKVNVSPIIQTVNGRPCYKIDVFGRTVGAFDWITTIRDNWRSYVDTTAIVSQKFYVNIVENKYRKEETVVFDHPNNKVRSEETDEKLSFNTPDNVQDVVSGYYYLRTLDYSKLEPGDVVSVPTFFDDVVFQTKIRFRGREVIKTKFGRINVIKLNPVIPENKLFKGENAIRIFISDDTNHVPVRVEVDLWVGSMVMEMKKYSGLRSPFKWF